MRVSVLTINVNFIGPLLNELKYHHEVALYQYSPDNAWNYVNIKSLLEWGDVAFFDFLHHPLPEATGFSVKNCKIVARLHGLEIFHYLPKVDWKKVDVLICSPPQAIRVRKAKLPSKIVELPIGTNPELFTPINPRNYGKNLCIVGNMLPRKRIYTTIQTIAPLLKEGWKLTLHGDRAGFRDDLRAEYKVEIKELIDILGVKDSVILNPFLASETYAAWLSAQDIIISNSVMEGYHKAIFDAMSCGVFPLVNCWLGADLLFPKASLFNSQQELSKKIRFWELKTDLQKSEWSKRLRQIVIDKHDEKQVAKRMREVIENA